MAEREEISPIDGWSGEPIDTTPDVASVNLLVRRTGCSIREAEITLGGMSRAEQQNLARVGRADLEKVRTVELDEALGGLADAGIDRDAPCPFGASKRGTQTWGDAVARLVYAGQRADVAALIGRGAA